INPIKVKAKDNNEFYNAILHRKDALLILEIEAINLAEDAHFPNFYHKIAQLIRDFRHPASLPAVYQTTTDTIRRLTGFDRVMLYCFDQDYNSQVVAESKEAHLNTFLHHHFPESDIPHQARQMYLKNSLRIDCGYPLCAEQKLFPTLNPITQNPLNLEMSSLRSVSPIHIEYLYNMGVRASMSISLLVDDKLWGLVACHHYQPRYIPVEVREAAEFFGQMVSNLIATKIQSQIRIREAEQHTILSNIIANMAQIPDFETALNQETNALLRLTDAEGMAWQINEAVQVFGKAPDVPFITKIAQWAARQCQGSEYHTHNLSRENQSFRVCQAEGSGILFISLSESHDKFIIWFRPEVIHTKKWVGKPEKVLRYEESGDLRLSPRKSFEQWQEKVKGQSAPWESTEISSAHKLRMAILNHIFRQAELLKKQKEWLEKKVIQRTTKLKNEVLHKQAIQCQLEESLNQLRQSNQELEHFAYIASHDLQEPLRKIQSFGDRLQSFIRQLPDERAHDYLERMINAANRMQRLINDLLSYSRISTQGHVFEKLDLNFVLAQVIADLQIRIDQKQALVEVAGLPKEVFADALQMHRLFLNLIQNALKFSKSEVQPHICIRSFAEQAYHCIEVRDNGIGFNEAYKEKIFHLFERLHGRTHSEGTGLGLAICKKIVERHQGKITAHSQPGEGATFVIYLPQEAPSAP
ncbi:MAG: GAF domain-containing protein, partial [Bacteroidia bacterium]|nr:GAF domain-containing protein [Bacteroidia bacterium]